MLFCETHDLVWEIISVSEKRMKKCIVKIIHNVFEQNDEGGLFPLNVSTAPRFAGPALSSRVPAPGPAG